MRKIAVVLDQDGTLTPNDTIFDFFDAFGKRELGERIYEWSKNAPERIEREFGIPRSKVYESIDVELVAREILRENGVIKKKVFYDIATNAKIFGGVERFITAIRGEGFPVFVASATYEPIARAFAKRVGIAVENVGATKMALDAGGNATGFVGPVMERGVKAEFVKAASRKAGVPLAQFVGIGDSASDDPFLNAISNAGGLSIKLNAEPYFAAITKKVMEYAEEV
jgi:HAD superfamily phosphoserine phosphatase-like hydrolase